MGEEQKNNSEVANLLREINAAYNAAQSALHGLAQGISQHEYITNRMERMGQVQTQLIELVGEDAAAALIAQQFCGDGTAAVL